MFGAPSFVPEVGRGYVTTPVTTYYYLGELAAPLINGLPTRQRVAWKGGRLYPNRHALSRANWGCLKGTIWTRRRDAWSRGQCGCSHSRLYSTLQARERAERTRLKPGVRIHRALEG